MAATMKMMSKEFTMEIRDWKSSVKILASDSTLQKMWNTLQQHRTRMAQTGMPTTASLMRERVTMRMLNIL